MSFGSLEFSLIVVFYPILKANLSIDFLISQLLSLHSLYFFVQFSRYNIANSVGFTRFNASIKTLVGSSGLEPPTSRLSGVRSNRLSYEPTFTWLEALEAFASWWR